MPTRPPLAVFAVPLYENAGHLSEAIDSLLGQSLRELAVVLVDDCSTDATQTVAGEIAARDERVSYVRNARRLGLVANWRRAFALARERHPEAPYFAWGSDHDVWDEHWLARLAAALDASPRAVLACPLSSRIDAGGEAFGGRPAGGFSTAGIAEPARRLAATVLGAPAGTQVYGLFRAAALERAGVLQPVLAPDRLLLAELALHGETVVVDELLWRRRFKHDLTRARQRRSIFPDGPPAWSYAPWYLQHAAVLAWRLGLRGDGRPDVSRPLGLAAAAGYPWLALGRFAVLLRRRARRRLRRLEKRLRRAAHRLRSG
jgi:glycosyltransferase involved in cell wall biosynthesis